MARLSLFINKFLNLGGYIYLCYRKLAYWWECSIMAPKTLGSIPGRVIQKTQKMVLDATLLNTQRYTVRNNPEKGVAPFIHFGVVAIEKGAFGSPLTIYLCMFEGKSINKGIFFKKANYFLFIYTSKLCIIWNWFIVKIILIS